MPDEPRWEFVSEPITPEKGGFDPAAMATGLASLPKAFTWRGRRHEVVECLEQAKQSKRESFSGEMYLKRQVFTVRLDSGELAQIYIERQAAAGASRRSAKQRWFLYAIASSGGTEPR